MLVILLLASAAVASILIARSIAISPRLASWRLFVPRTFVLGALLLILTDPARVTEEQLPPQRAAVAYLVDGSRSMALDRPSSRIDQARQAIYQAAAGIPEDRLPRIELYRFGSRLAAIPGVPELDAIDEASRLADALAALPARFQSDLPGAVVVFSDGQIDQPERPAEIAEVYRRLGVPIHAFPLGDATLRGDIAIQDLIVPRRAQPGVTVPIRATIRGSGFAGQRVVIAIRSASDAAGPPLATLPITLSDEPQAVELAIAARRDAPQLVIEAPPLAGEAIVENNRVPFQLASGDRKMRVIYMEGTAGQEYRFIHNALTEDPDIECLSMVVDGQYVARPRLQRVDDPYRGFPATREELFSYDVVICSDISQGAFTREQLEWTAELVGERGGGFAMVGGHTSFGAGRWDQTVWDRLIPVDMSGGNVGSGFLTQQFHVFVPPEAEAHAIWHLVDDPVKNRQALNAMPAFYGSNLIKRLKPAATLLAQSATPLPRVGIMPVFASESYGRGRTFALASDSTAYWGQDFERYWGEGDNRYFRKFWRNVVRWLSENSIAGSKRLWIETDKIIYRRGEPIELTATAYDTSAHESTAYELTAQLVHSPEGRPDGPAAGTSPSQLVPDVARLRYHGSIEARVPDRPVGAAGEPFSTLQATQLEVVARDGGREIARTQVEVQVLLDSSELERPSAAPKHLRELSSFGGGRVLDNAQQLAGLLREFPPTPGETIIHRTPSWDRSWFWLLLVGLLGIEWTLRRLGVQASSG